MANSTEKSTTKQVAFQVGVNGDVLRRYKAATTLAGIRMADEIQAHMIAFADKVLVAEIAKKDAAK